MGMEVISLQRQRVTETETEAPTKSIRIWATNPQHSDLLCEDRIATGAEINRPFVFTSLC